MIHPWNSPKVHVTLIATRSLRSKASRGTTTTATAATTAARAIAEVNPSMIPKGEDILRKTNRENKTWHLFWHLFLGWWLGRKSILGGISFISDRKSIIEYKMKYEVRIIGGCLWIKLSGMTEILCSPPRKRKNYKVACKACTWITFIYLHIIWHLSFFASMFQTNFSYYMQRLCFCSWCSNQNSVVEFKNSTSASFTLSSWNGNLQHKKLTWSKTSPTNRIWLNNSLLVTQRDFSLTPAICSWWYTFPEIHFPLAIESPNCHQTWKKSLQYPKPKSIRFNNPGIEDCHPLPKT